MANAITITETEAGLYLKTISKGITYGQHYRDTDIITATKLFKELVNKYETKGTLAVMGGH